MQTYYNKKLSSDRLRKCYEIATPRVQQYLKAEINHVLTKIRSTDLVLELGCGYGRVLPSIAKKAKSVVGIDTSRSSISLGREMLRDYRNCSLIRMNAIKMDFPDCSFDIVICIQNGISAFHVDQANLIKETIRVTKPGGLVLFSSYSDKFWKYRLKWFELQAKAGLIGQIDRRKTHHGTIICKDGFTASTVSPSQFRKLTSNIKNVKTKITEIDRSSVFCEIHKNRISGSQ